jgi:endogenous inhibitor of DNA gyrase (YacG/DUF329 family)
MIDLGDWAAERYRVPGEQKDSGEPGKSVPDPDSSEQS